MITIAGIQYELFEAEWQMMEEANTEHRNRQPGANTRYNYLNDLLQMKKCIPYTASIVARVNYDSFKRSTVGESTPDQVLIQKFCTEGG